MDGLKKNLQLWTLMQPKWTTEIQNGRNCTEMFVTWNKIQILQILFLKFFA